MKLSRLFPQERCESRAQGSAALEAVAAAFAYLCLMLGQSLLSFVLSGVAPSLSGTLSLFGSALAFVPIYVLCLRLGGLKAEDLYISGRGALRKTLFGLLSGGGVLLLLILALLLCSGYAYVGVARSGAPYLPLLLLSFLVQGSAEELLCRGLVMSAISARHGGRIGAAGSALFFSLLHAMNPSVTLLGLWNVFLFGLLFAAVTQRTKSLFYACGVHAGWNFFLSLFGVQISGNAPRVSLFLLESRIDWLSGGGFGPEGSPMLTAFLLAALFLLAFFKKVKK